MASRQELLHLWYQTDHRTWLFRFGIISCLVILLGAVSWFFVFRGGKQETAPEIKSVVEKPKPRSTLRLVEGTQSNDDQAPTAQANEELKLQATEIQKFIEEMDSLQAALRLEDGATHLWTLFYSYSDQDYKPLSAIEVLKRVTEATLSEDGTNSFLIENRGAFEELFSRTRIFGDELTAFLSSPKDTSLPIRFCNYNKKPCVLVTKLASENVFNTLKLTAKQRAARFIESHLLTVLRNFDECLYDKNVPYYGVIAFYGTRNFLDKSNVPTRCEGVALIVPREGCRNLTSGSISRDELLRNSEVFQVNDDTRNEFQKIEVAFE